MKEKDTLFTWERCCGSRWSCLAWGVPPDTEHRRRRSGCRHLSIPKKRILFENASTHLDQRSSIEICTGVLWIIISILAKSTERKSNDLKITLTLSFFIWLKFVFVTTILEENDGIFVLAVNFFQTNFSVLTSNLWQNFYCLRKVFLSWAQILKAFLSVIIFRKIMGI